MKRFLQFFLLLLITASLLTGSAWAAYGVVTDATFYTVDTGGGLVFKVHRTDGSIRSIKYNGGVELQDQSKWSHLGSSYGSVTSTLTTYGSGTPATTDDFIKIACATSASNSYSPSLTHHFIVRRGQNIIYMATYLTQQPGVGEFRWITRLQATPFPDSPTPSDIRGNVGNAESTDVKLMADGTTRSKYYGDAPGRGKDRAMDLTYCGISGPGVGAYMIFGNRESASGGPFYRDIQNQSTEVYNYMNSGHVQTEAPRGGVLHGPYALVFTSGGMPAYPLDFSWMDSAGLGLPGYVAASGRGTVSGTASGIPAGFQGVVGFSNTTAQYWAKVAANGTYSCSGMKPGTYTVRLYKDELAVPLSTGGTSTTVTVTAGTTTSKNLISAESYPAHIFKLGEWDGTPAGFRNFGNLISMHPSDSRQDSWGPVNHTVESNPTSDFPAIQFRLANSPSAVRFTLNSSQASSSRVLRIGITCALYGGRPQVKVNNRWTSAIPSSSSQPGGRCFTLGTWRGNNHTFTYTIPSSAFNTGGNVLTISPVSGSSDLGTWLSAGWAYDCIQLDGPPLVPPVASGLNATPGDGRVSLAWNQVYNATSYIIQRGTSASGPFTTLGTSLIATYTDTSATNLTTHHYVVRAVNGAGTGLVSASVSATPVPLVQFANGGFELPVIPALQYNPSGGSWTFSGASPSGSGISADKSAFTNNNPNAPEGAQVAFLQSLGTLSQNLANLVVGEFYRITFLAAQRNVTQTPQTWDVRIDGVTRKNFAPPQSSTTYQEYSASFQATATSQLLAFTGTRSGDSTIFLDHVRVERVPPPPAGLIWQGDGINNRWDFTANNWTSTLVPTPFTNGRPVTFDSEGSITPAVSLMGVLSPSSITVSSAASYSFAGTGTLAGTAVLAKSGTGTLTLSTANTFNGGVVHGGGDLQAQHSSSLGSGSISITAPNTTTITRLNLGPGINLSNPIAVFGRNTNFNGVLRVPGANDSATLSGPITVHPGVAGSGGTFAGPSGNGWLSITGPVNQSSPSTGPSVRCGRVRFSGGGNATDFSINQDLTSLGADNGLPPSSVLFIAASGAATFDLNGHDQTLAGLVRGGYMATVTNSGAASLLNLTTLADQSYTGDFSGNLQLLKSGPATFTISGTNTHNGGTSITAGTLALDQSGTPKTITLENPDFETPILADDTTVGLTNTGWTSSTTPGESSGSAGLARGTTTWGSPSSDGDQYVYFWRSAQVSQNVTLPAGLATLRFLLASRSNKTPVEMEIRLISGGVPTTVATFSSASQTSAWTERSADFTVPADGTYTLAFAARQPAGATDWGSNIDAVELSILSSIVRALPTNSPVAIGPAGALELNGLSATIGGLTDHSLGSAGLVKNSGESPATLILDVGSGNTRAFAGDFQDAGTASALQLRKRGSGVQTLSGNLTHRGATVVEAGTLRLANSLNVSPLTVAAGGTLAPDGTPSVPSLGLAGGGNLAFTLSAGAADRLHVTGTATIAGTANVTLENGLAFGRFPLITHGSRTGSLTLGNVSPVVPARLVHESGQITLVLDDSDDDGLPDTWEQTHFGTGNLDQGPTGDFDADGTGNRAELLLGLDPANGSSAFRATIQPSGAHFTLTWPTAAGLSFRVERSTTLSGPWSNLATVQTGTYTDNEPPPGRAFYRVILLMP
jgi:rhamnogalacturonan endolyase